VTGIALMHGWGYGPWVWRDWTDAFAGRPLALLDAGYFGEPAMTLPHNPDGWVGIGHSQGFARLIGMDVPWRGLVGFGAFLRFCRLPGHDDGTPPEIIDAMLARMDSDPADVLRRFTRRCGREERCTAPLDPAGVARLRDALRDLRSLDISAPRRPVPTLLVHAADDRIVPVSLAESARTVLGARLEIIPKGGHALPFTRSADCLRPVQEFIDGLA
jgi:pimeloyl-[acyl-carrier protein] methyl ester esterase